MDNWGQGVSPAYDQREIILTVRSVDADDPIFGKRDTIPQTDTEKAAILGMIRRFSYRMATCVDYMQFGNEVWGGAGGYAFFNGQLNCPGNFTIQLVLADVLRRRLR